ncbi:MAG: hypothetical protein ACO1SV_23555 [Fimbriimonas sp.]
MRRRPVLISASCVALGTLLGLGWVASQPTPLPHRFLDGAVVVQREGWAEFGGNRFKDNGTYRLGRPIAAVEATIKAELTEPGWKFERKPASILISRDQAYITLLDRGPQTTVHIQSYRGVTPLDRLRHWWRKMTR